MSRAYTWLVIGVRMVLAVGLLRVGTLPAYVLLISEAWAWVTTLCQKRTAVFGWGWLVPWLYLSPSLFRGGVVLVPFASYIVASLVFWQIVLRCYMGLRCTVGVPGFRSLLSRGPYSVVRHPLAAVEMLLIVCYPLAAWSWWNLGVSCAAVVFLWLVVLLEEAHLRGFEEYRAYAHEVHCRFVPGLY